MRTVPKHLLEESRRLEAQQERLAPFALSMLMSDSEVKQAMTSAYPIAIKRGSSWSAALWISSIADPNCGQLFVVKQNCKSPKLARITANYYRLHQLIKDTDNSTNPFFLH